MKCRADVPEPRPEVLRRLHQRFQLKVARLKGRELRHEMCGQVVEGFRETGESLPRTERRYDAVRISTWNVGAAMAIGRRDEGGHNKRALYQYVNGCIKSWVDGVLEDCVPLLALEGFWQTSQSAALEGCLNHVNLAMWNDTCLTRVCMNSIDIATGQSAFAPLL